MINFCELNKICISNIGSYRFFLKYFSRLKTDHECEIPTCKFLVACTRLYMSLCRSVGRSVRLSVGLSEITSLCFTFLGVLSLKEVRFELLPLPNYHTAPAHPHATDAVVYTALLVLVVDPELPRRLPFAFSRHFLPSRRFGEETVDFGVCLFPSLPSRGFKAPDSRRFGGETSGDFVFLQMYTCHGVGGPTSIHFWFFQCKCKHQACIDWHMCDDRFRKAGR